MAQTSFGLLAAVLLLLLVVLAEGGPPKQMKVKCQDRKFPNCYHKDLFCPVTCPRTCIADCNSCQPICVPPPLPPPKPRSPMQVRCQDKKFPTCYHKSFPCPANCPRACVADCASCQPVCTVSPPLSPPLPPTPPSAGGKRVSCKNKLYPQCYRQEFQCPSDCPDTCEVDCVTCSPVCDCNKPGAVCQDPRFIGADGLTFYFHGKKDDDFCLVTDSNLHINAHFIGRRNENMKRDFTWVQSLGILFKNHKLFIGAKNTSTWNDALDRLDLAYDGQSIILPNREGTKWEPISSTQGVSITRNRDTNSVLIDVEGNFQIKARVVPITEKDSRIHNYGITEENCFAHLDLSFKFYSLSGKVNGVLGQTYGSNYVSRVKMGIDMPVLGGEKEFSSSGIFSTDCAVSRFSGTYQLDHGSKEDIEYADLKCASGMDGKGVVCKR
ncbi:uncharacterized protein LOC132638348 [Lycium barbarum]|uniref:uncharacterized protein LOC132638348 n=1 Tax=Lycium barbarum TaxID=112863 RepID=UPI00293E7452|nr:uncharacterized protein LOC132638348 [Lycium barbarum]